MINVLLSLLFVLNVGSYALEEDPKGYLVYCPCMGRFGNQADQFLGVLNFAKGLDRTLIIPPWVEYHGGINSTQIPFDTYFKVRAINEFTRAITMEEFMKKLAPKIWPAGDRTVFCYGPRGDSKESCNAKEGNPFGPFWDTFKINFDSSEFYGPISYDTENKQTADQWKKRYPPEKFKVLAFTGAPSHFPAREKDVPLHKYMKWSDKIDRAADDFVSNKLVRPYLGIHMRNGVDWTRACEHVSPGRNLFSSAQCLGFRLEHGQLSTELCAPPDSIVLKQIKKTAKKIKAKSIFVASDSRHMISEIEKAVKPLKDVKVVRDFSKSPHLDLAILGRADHYIGNCVSTFSAFAGRERLVNDRPTTYWAFTGSGHDEL